MFHYNGYKRRSSYDIEVGDYVQSTYRATWTGFVHTLNTEDGTATVQPVMYQHGNMFKKRPKVKTYHCTHFKVLVREKS